MSGYGQTGQRAHTQVSGVGFQDTRCKIQDTGCRQPGKLANRLNRPTGQPANGQTG
ncbi:hypothetical protein D3OALGB2SA_5282 [Olavius algarvensis associated proteobacterium Delta 3]|nr:hypothetical protein D3OALGB2SA_5282 [Olavius algarvensis associated proteobacterium Delta 3]